MSDLQIVREQKSGFTTHGLSVQSDEIYIKVLTSFKAQLKSLKGAPLSVFLCIALHEADIMLKNQEPLTLSAIQDITGYSRPTVATTLDDLVERRFIDELPELGKFGEKQYRVCAYSWFGEGRIMSGKKSLPPEKILPRISNTSLNKESTNTRQKSFLQDSPQMVTVSDDDGDGQFYCSGCAEYHAIGDVEGNKLPCGCIAYFPGKRLLTLPDTPAFRFLKESYRGIELVITEKQLKLWQGLERDYNDDTIIAMTKWATRKPFSPRVVIERIVKAVRKHYTTNAARKSAQSPDEGPATLEDVKRNNPALYERIMARQKESDGNRDSA